MRRSLYFEERLLMHLALLHCGRLFLLVPSLMHWINAGVALTRIWGSVRLVYSPERMMGRVGVVAPATFSIVMPKAFAGTLLGILGNTSEA
jgi:hypothetical protein